MTVSDIQHIRTRKRTRTQPESTQESQHSSDPRVTEIDAALASGRYLEWADLLTEERSRLLTEPARKILAA
jgi:hypothetical protein